MDNTELLFKILQEEYIQSLCTITMLTLKSAEASYSLVISPRE